MSNPFIPAVNGLLPEPQASLLNGILWGTKASMPAELYQSLITTGLLHIIALSGMNITILMNLIAGITISFRRRLSLMLTAATVIAYVVFTGSSPSVIRAAIMGLLSLIAVYLGRQSWALLSLFLAAGIMLLYDWTLSTNISFQLSFFATFGILLAQRKGKCQNNRSFLGHVTSAVKENFRLTLSAQLFTLPVMLFTFHRVSFIAPVSNVMTEWVVQPIMILGFITALGALLWEPLGIVLSWFIWLPLTYFIWVVELLAKVPGAAISW